MANSEGIGYVAILKYIASNGYGSIYLERTLVYTEKHTRGFSLGDHLWQGGPYMAP